MLTPIARVLLAGLLLAGASPAHGLALRSAAPRRRQCIAAALAAAAAAPPPGFAASREEIQAANLARAREREAEIDRQCAGRRAIDRGVQADYFDMTFDPPCYVSGYYEVLAYALPLGALKLYQLSEERCEVAEAASAREESEGGAAVADDEAGV